MVAALKEQLGNGFLGNFVGHPEDVARALEGLADLGIERVQITETVPGSQQNLRPFLCG